MKNLVISGVGCTLIDFLYPQVDFHSPEFFKYSSKRDGDGGLSPGKLVFTEELEKFADTKYSKILGEITGPEASRSYNLGGPALVSLIHVSQMLNREDFDVKLYAGLGRDKMAEIIFDLLGKTPLNISNLIQTGKRATPFTDVFSDPDFDDGHGERTFVNNIGAAWNYLPEQLDDGFFNSDIVCFGGTALMPVIHDHLSALLGKAKRNNCITVVNTVYDFRNEKKDPNNKWPLGDDAKTLQLIDLLIMDGEESLRISGKQSLDDAADYFVSSGCPAFIITNGAKDFTAYSGGGLFAATGLRKLPVSEKIRTELKSNTESTGDTTGCGDNFAGGVIASVADQMKTGGNKPIDFLESVAWGVASGGFTGFYTGGTYFEEKNGKKREQVRYYFEDYLNQIQGE